MNNHAVVQALTLAMHYVRQEMPDAAIEEMAVDLAAYPESAVVVALKRCRSELRTIRFADILDRLPGGHPGPEEAWAIVSRCLNNEQVSVVWTDQMREAYGVAAALASDAIAARMAFKESYGTLVREAQLRSTAPAWSVSLGYDPQLREVALQEAVSKNRISAMEAQRWIPQRVDLHDSVKALTTQIGGR